MDVRPFTVAIPVAVLHALSGQRARMAVNLFIFLSQIRLIRLIAACMQHVAPQGVQAADTRNKEIYW